MNNSRFEWKVGVFVACGLAVLAILLLNFSKGITRFKSNYTLYIKMPNTAGLKPKADVMMAGVPIGSVSSAELSPDGKLVVVAVRILSKYGIYSDAKFHIDALGFLGDQYIAVTPTKNQGHPLKDGETVQGEEPFNLQEAVRSTSSLLESARETMKSLDQAITNVNRTILSEETLTNFGLAISNLQSVTESAVKIANDAETLLTTNTPAINGAVSNLQVFSHKLNTVADDVTQTIANNTNGVAEIVSNLRDTSANLKQLSADLQAGKGLAGTLLKDEKMKVEISSMITNVNELSANLSLWSSNLNQHGLWRMLWKPKQPPQTAAAQEKGRPGKH